MSQQAEALFIQARAVIANVTADMMQKGIPDFVCLAALGATAGNLIGLNHPNEEHGSIIESMREPMLTSARAARKLKDTIVKPA